MIVILIPKSGKPEKHREAVCRECFLSIRSLIKKREPDRNPAPIQIQYPMKNQCKNRSSL